jgi:hypothetical protein
LPQIVDRKNYGPSSGWLMAKEEAQEQVIQTLKRRPGYRNVVYR